MITIVDYGMGNLRSVAKAFERVGATVEVTNAPDVVASAERLVLPGVGAFQDAIRQLNDAHLIEPIQTHIARGKPFLGICLGLQLLFTKSFEDGEHLGLDVIEGEVVRFKLPSEWKVPHMGWNRLDVVRSAPALADLPSEANTYFVHSYHVVPSDRSVIATLTDYGGPFVSSVWRDNVFATQFHPEKSQSVGLAMLKRFAAL